ncbi:MAG: cobalt ECF transporter T component CbiQ [Thermodesulfobacteriota bacterium]|nr:cobalt ECF transporter T component CbiQ [Thermodesulfobacteriota bacterium]
MTFEEFSAGDSFIHHLDPRIKLVIAILFSTVVAVANKLVLLFAAICFPIVLISVARLSIKKVQKSLLLVNGFILFLWLLMPFTYAGETLFSLGSLHASKEGVMYCVLITLKSNTIILTCMILLATSKISALVHALRHLYIPDKLVQLFFFCYRYIHVIHIEYSRLRNAMKIRCFKPQTNIHTYKTYAYLIGLLLIKSYDRSERVYKAMLCRGFKGKFWVLDHFSLKRSDVVAGIIMVLYIIGLVFLQWRQIIL